MTSTLHVKSIADSIVQIESEIEAKKAALQEAKAQLLDIVGPQFTAALAAKGKTHGSVTLEIEDVPLTLEVKQTVSWDQELLQGIYESLPLEIASRLIEVKFNVSEKMYAGCTDPNILDALTDARTTKLSNPTLKIKTA